MQRNNVLFSGAFGNLSAHPQMKGANNERTCKKIP